MAVYRSSDVAQGSGQTQPPQDATGQQSEFVEIGRSGLKHVAGYIQEEFVTNLRGQRGAKVYREMGENCPTVGMALMRVKRTLGKTNWRVDPSDAHDEEAVDIARFVDECREDMSNAWTAMLSEAFSMVQYGYAPTEIVYKRREGPGGDTPSKFDDGRIGWRKIALRSQESVTRWDINDEDGGIEAMHQQPAPTYREFVVPIERLLLFRTETERNNPEGRSLLRSAYYPYQYWKGFTEKAAIGAERDLCGIPVGRVPGSALTSEAPADQKSAAAEMRKIVENLRQHEQASVVLSSSRDPVSNQFEYDLSLLQSAGAKQFDVLSLIKHCELQMALAILADDALIGHEGSGSYALADVQGNTIQSLLESFLDSVADVFNRYGIPRLLELNGLPLDKAPILRHTGIVRRDALRLAQFLKTLADAGVPVFPDETLTRALYAMEDLPLDGREEREDEKPPDDTGVEGGAVTIPTDSQESKIPKAAAPDELAKGDLPGHEFHGNQWTDGGGDAEEPTTRGQFPATSLGDHDIVGLEDVKTDHAIPAATETRLQRGYPPIILEPDGTLIDGYHRFAAARESGAEEIKAIVISPEEREAMTRFPREEDWIDWVQQRHGTTGGGGVPRSR